MLPITFGKLIPEVKGPLNKKICITQNDVLYNPRYIKILMDSGTSMSIIDNYHLNMNKFDTNKTSANKWSKMAICFTTPCGAEVKIKLPELNVKAHILVPFYIIDHESIMM